MDPFEILGVDRNASPGKIRDAYRRLVKQYHPDVNPSPDAAQMTALINQAYDLITSNHWSLNNDPLAPPPGNEEPEDPVEAYKREYKARKFREAKAKKEARIRRYKGIYAFGRFLCFPAALYSLIVILDFYLPSKIEYDVPIKGYQQVIHGKYSSYVESYMRLSTRDVEVPDEMHLKYDYDAKEKKPIYLEFAPMLGSLKRVGVVNASYTLVYTAPTSPYMHFFLVLPYIILGLSVIFIIKKKYSIDRYPFCMFPAALWIILLIKMS